MKILAFLLSTLIIVAQEPTPKPTLQIVEAAFVASNQTPHIGEPFQLTLTANIPASMEIVEWPKFEEDWFGFHLLRIGEVVESPTEDNSTLHAQHFEARLWSVGDHTTPDTFISYVFEDPEDTFSIPVKPAFFTVPSVLESQELNSLEFRPLKDPIRLFYIPPLLIGVAFSVVVASGYQGRRWWLKRRAKLEQLRLEALQPTPADIALGKLKQLRDEKHESTQIYAEVAGVLRTYLSKRTIIVIEEKTTSELILKLEGSNLFASSLVNDLRRMLEQADLVKFASYVPDENTTSRILALAYRWITQMEDQIEEEPSDDN